MTSSSALIQNEVKALTDHVAKVEEEYFELGQKLERARRELSAWQTIQRMRTGVAATVEAANEKPQLDGEEYGQKSRVMKEHILTSLETGVTPKSVQEYMQKVSLPVSINFVYKTLNKLKADGEITSEGGVFRPAVAAG